MPIFVWNDKLEIYEEWTIEEVKSAFGIEEEADENNLGEADSEG